jgi:hypothetical protein
MAPQRLRWAPQNLVGAWLHHSPMLALVHHRSNSAAPGFLPNWGCPFQVVRCTPGNAYILKTLLGEEFTAAINGRYLKKYYPSIEINC